MNQGIIQSITEEYRAQFGGEPLLVRAPGRINVIGEHTDYNEGFVLPAAVEQAIYFAVGVSEDPEQCTLISLDQHQRYDFKLAELKPLPPNSWQNYLLGVVAQILGSGRALSGFRLVFSGDVPQGSGMSSSAALECGTCFALNTLFDLGIGRVEMLKMAQKAEHTYAGVMCGIMDQFASMMGRADQVLLLDCRSLDYQHIDMALGNDYTLLLCNSNVTHNLASSGYNERRSQCEEGVELLKRHFTEALSLRDISREQLDRCKGELREVVYRRCKYVIEENERVNHLVEALGTKDFDQVGLILQRAQAAMRHEYEITCPEIDFMADWANARPEVLGARMMGGGFGGCTINLVQASAAQLLTRELNAAYQQKFGKEITPIPISIADGVDLVQPVA